MPATRHIVAPMDTPCIKVCVIDPGTGLCSGCGRSTHEIGRWTTYTDAQRHDIMRSLADRVARPVRQSG